MSAEKKNRSQNLYQRLGVKREASPQEIKQAYRALARKYHPDTNPDDADAAEKFKEIAAAYRALINPDSRARYDRWLDREDWRLPGRDAPDRPYRDYRMPAADEDSTRVPFKALFMAFAFVLCAMVMWLMFLLEVTPQREDPPTDTELTATAQQATLDAIHENVPEFENGEEAGWLIATPVASPTPEIDSELFIYDAAAPASGPGDD
jgi:hypothetical protein